MTASHFSKLQREEEEEEEEEETQNNRSPSGPYQDGVMSR